MSRETNESIESCLNRFTDNTPPYTRNDSYEEYNHRGGDLEYQRECADGSSSARARTIQFPKGTLLKKLLHWVEILERSEDSRNVWTA